VAAIVEEEEEEEEEESGCLEALSWDKDEENAERSIDESSHCQDHDGALGDERADIGFADAREVERGVLAVTNKGHDRVQRVLVRRKEINTDGEW
jgi:hypothetical protein